MSPFKFYASYPIEFPATLQLITPFSVGTIAPSRIVTKTRPTSRLPRSLKRDWIPTKLSLAPTSEPIRRIDFSAKHYVLLSEEEKSYWT